MIHEGISLSLSFFIFLNLSHKEERRVLLPIASSCHIIWNKEKVISHNEMSHCSTIDGNLLLAKAFRIWQSYMEWVFFYYEGSECVPFQWDIQAVKEQRLSGRDWRRADGTDKHGSTSICVFVWLAGRAIKYKDQLCRITLCWKVMGKKNEGYPVCKGLLLEAEPAGLGLSWNHWLIMGLTQNIVAPSRQCP